MANAGRYKHVVEIQQATETRGAMGGTEKTWATFKACRADIRHIGGKELLSAGQLQAEVQARAFIRYTEGITAKMRLVHLGDVYDIAAPPIDRTGNRRELELWLAHGVNEG